MYVLENNHGRFLIHALCECPDVAAMWNMSSSILILRDAPRSSVFSLLQWMMDHVSNEEVLSLCITLWAAWFFRIKEVFSDEQCDPIQVAATLHKMVRDFKDYAVKVQIAQRDSLLKFHYWNKPHTGWELG